MRAKYGFENYCVQHLKESELHKVIDISIS